MAYHKHRSQYYLTLAIKHFLTHNLQKSWVLKDVKVEVRGEGSNWVLLSVKDIDSNLPHYYEIKVTQKMG